MRTKRILLYEKTSTIDITTTERNDAKEFGPAVRHTTTDNTTLNKYKS